MNDTTNNLIPLHMQEEGEIWINGKFVKWQDAKIHLLSHALHYSTSVYEGMKSYNKNIFKARDHLKRLINSANLFDMEIKYSVNEIISIIQELLERNNLGDSYIRPLVFKTSDNLILYNSKEYSNFMIAAWKSRMKNNPRNNVLLAGRRPVNDFISPQCKASSNYSSMYLAVSSAKKLDFDDVLFLDENHHINECSTSNIFFAKDNVIYTPKIDLILNGITRQTVIEIARNLSYEVIEKDLKIDEIMDMDESFVTGTAVCIKAINSISILGDNDFTKITSDIPKINLKSQLLSETIRRKYLELAMKES